MRSEVAYGNTLLSFSIERSDRKLLSIEVNPDLSINVIAPHAVEITAIEEKVLKRAKWIIKQQQFFEQFLPRTPEREYVSGETHFYLGRKYLLRIRLSEENMVKLKGGELIVHIKELKNTSMIKVLLNVWYYNHAKRIFENCVKESIKEFTRYDIIENPPITIKRMNKRWGSCTPKGRIVLNPELIKTPLMCVKYVIIHELCHLVHPNHSKEFYELQVRMMPNWEKWKLKLEKSLI
ncbi:M48 family metallopeptidase [Algoriphagus zhangzhouensis]|uniref:YgjP-like metallopeptidase domain-containing protein n=1 Tax=Algoriphagus zhangzhouensis TaxID=1073327 RepID=A0A1M7Z4Q9_9BACT|nr:SprT family zinc-dependent metalloprotease [Algoriphagus zhangzhouensis]TDY48774.1 hypothetical protein A8938_0460 [Algoriphagus zhangzhouensis]SHO59933.1 hypothetical protein SAMN04488108_0460 [Algoriphagus zhangzhouensis]